MIIVLILSCMKNEEQRLNQKWIINNSFLRCLYVVGDENLEEESLIKENILYVKCEDDICHLPKKFICALAAIENYEYVFVTEDDYFLCKSTLFRECYVAMEKYKGDYGGTMKTISEEKMAGGFRKHMDFPFTVMLKPCSYMKKGLILLSERACLDLLKKREDFEKEYVCDYAIGYHLDKSMKRIILNTSDFMLHWRKYVRKI